METASNGHHPIGSLEWAAHNSGVLLPEEKDKLRASIRNTVVDIFKGLFTSEGIGKINRADRLLIPDSRIVEEAEQECLNELSPKIITHSLRTFVFGIALARIDEVYQDRFKDRNVFQDADFIEHFYVTSLLHDLKIESQNTHTCFAVASGRKTASIAEHSGRADISQDLGNAISLHITPGINKSQPGFLAALIS